MDGLIAYALSKKYADEVGRSILGAGFKTQVEQDRSILQTTGQEKILYLIPKTTASPSDGYDEYVYSNNAWEQIGATDVNLSSYATKAEIGSLSNLPTTDKSSIVSAISETFTSVSNGKSLVASAITDKGISTSSDATFEIMAQNIEAIPTGSLTVLNPALVLWDWEGTKLAEYSAEGALALTELPTPSTLPAYAYVDHELLLFQKWNWSLANIKTWIQNHEGETLDVGAIYTTTDEQDHNYWDNPRLDTATTITMQKRGTASIRNGAFYDCVSLAQINIPEGVTDVDGSAFYDCVSLAQINIPDSVTSIGSDAFYSCLSLKQINIPDSMTSIGYNAFYNCYPLARINIPDSVTSIGSDAFRNCYSLAQINIPDSVTSIGSGAFRNCLSLKQINIPDSVTSINDYTFHSCLSLKQINIPDSVTSIGTHAFYSCLSLKQINIPDSVTNIGHTAFQNCYSLTQINIPDSVTSIGDNTFLYCKTLCDILNESKSTLLNKNAFDGLPSIYRVYVPRANLSWFETATNWSTIYTQGHIVAIEDNINYLESIGFNVDVYKGAA